MMVGVLAASAARSYAQELPWLVTLSDRAAQQQLRAEKLFQRDSVRALLPNTNGMATRIFKVYAGSTTERDLRQLQSAGIVSHFERDAIGFACGEADPDDPVFSKQWYLRNDGTLSIFAIQAKAGADIDLLNAWSITQGDSTVTIAILDTGITPAHPEFTGRLWHNAAEIPENSIDDDRNGFVDDHHGWNFVSDSPLIDDDNGHGTAIAGVIAANAGNAVSITGINAKSKIMVCKVLGRDQSGLYSDWVAGIHYAVDNGADIINMSVAGETDLKILSDAVAYAYHRGVLVVCSMGNQNGAQPYYPAAYDYTFAVGSTDPDDKRSVAFNGNVAAGSNHGSHIDVVAPGNVVYGLNRTSYGANTLWGGTSMSSAVVTGVASLVLSVKPQLTAPQLRSILVAAAKDEVGLPPEDVAGWDSFYGFGRIDAFRAVSLVYAGEQVMEADRLILYPVPATREITVSILLPGVGPVAIQIVDAQGRTWLQDVVDATSPLLQQQVLLPGMPAGIYTMVAQKSGRIYQRRFVVVD